MSAKKILYCDTETTALPSFKLPADGPGQPHLVQLAALLCEADGSEIAGFHALVKPEGWTIPREATDIHGITTERALAEGAPLANVMQQFAELHDQADFLVSYGIHFDTKILRGAYRRAGMDDRYRRCNEWCAQNAAAHACRLQATERMVLANRGHQYKTPRLSEAYAILTGEPFLKSHDALEDVRALRRIVLIIRDQQKPGESTP